MSEPADLALSLRRMGPRTLHLQQVRPRREDRPMPSPQVIAEIQERLATHRATLAIRLTQQAALGSAHVPPEVTHDIREARAAIAHLKATLRGWGEPVEDLPDDGVLVPPQPVPSPSPSRLEPRSGPVPLEPPEGTMHPASPFYIERQPADRIAAAAAARRDGVTLTIKGPRQVGKSSLLARAMATAGAVGKQVAYLDFQQFDAAARAHADTFFQQFVRWIGDELGLPTLREADWPLELGTVQRCTRYVERVLLPALNTPVLLAMDEVDSILDCTFRTDFFAMLRVWHNNRAMPNRPLWRKLDLVLVTSTEPYELVQNLHQSPFNVGEVIELVDFVASQVARLNTLHGSPLSLEDETRLVTLLNGHPYLTRRALYLVADGRMPCTTLFAQAATDDGPFGEHLRRHIQRLHERPELAHVLRQIVRTQRCTDDRAFWRLHGAGLVRRDGEQTLMRCQLYADYFAGRLR